MNGGADAPAPRAERGAGLGAVRDELKALGYLGDPLQRWVLGDVMRRPRVLAPALRAAVLAAALSGLVLTAAQVSWSRLLAAHPLDVAVVAVVSAALLLPVMLSSLLAVAAGVLLTTARPRATGLWVARAVAVAGFAYGSVWWWQRASSRGGLTLKNVAVLGLLALLAWMVARLAAVSAAALASARGVAAVGASESVASRSGQRSAVLGTVVAALLVVAVPAALRPAPRPPAMPLERSPGVPRLAVIAVDGLAASDLAHLARVSEPAAAWLARAARRELSPGASRLPPPVVWTTVATGRDPFHHGVRSLLVDRVPGIDTAFGSGYGVAAIRAVLRSLLPQAPDQEPVSEALRREKTFFEVAAEAGVEVVVANWWATYPATIARGSVLSDRALAGLLAGSGAAHAVYPPEWGRALELVWPALRGDLERGDTAVERARLGDQFHAQLALERFTDTNATLLALYFQAPDVWWSAMPEGGSARFDTDLAAVGDWISKVSSVLGDDGVVVVVGHPGRTRTGASGVVAMVGGGSIAGDYSRARLEDLAPTLLYLLGLPQSDELSGRVLYDVLPPERVRAQPPRTVLSYGGKSGAVELDDDDSADAARERLRSLGYVNE